MLTFLTKSAMFWEYVKSIFIGVLAGVLNFELIRLAIWLFEPKPSCHVAYAWQIDPYWISIWGWIVGYIILFVINTHQKVKTQKRLVGIFLTGLEVLKSRLSPNSHEALKEVEYCIKNIKDGKYIPE